MVKPASPGRSSTVKERTRFIPLLVFHFFDFQFRSLCGTARIPYAAGGLEKHVVLPQNYSVAKTLKQHACRALFQGANISRKPATFEDTKISGCVKDSCAYPRTQF